MFIIMRLNKYDLPKGVTGGDPHLCILITKLMNDSYLRMCASNVTAWFKMATENLIEVNAIKPNKK